MPAEGITNVSFPLESAAAALRSTPDHECRMILLSDCAHNAGPDPRTAAVALPCLDVLLDVTGEHDRDLGRELSRAGRGRLFRIREHRDVAPALNAALADPSP